MEARLDVVELIVENMAQSLAFYRHLGLNLPPDADREQHVETTLPGGLRLAWDTVETIQSFNPDWTPPGAGYRMGLAFLLASPTDVDRAYDELVSLGYTGHKQPWDAYWGQRYASILDPDGNNVDLFAPSNAG